MACASWLLNLDFAGSVVTVVAGVFDLAEAQVYVPGAAEAEVYVSGAKEEEVQP